MEEEGFIGFLIGGFVKEKKDGKFFSHFNKTFTTIYEIDVSDKQYEDLKNTLEQMEENKKDYKYDFLGLIPRYFGVPYSRKNKFVCSSFIAKLLEDAKIHKFNKKTCLAKPKDFEKIDNLKQVYCGYFNEY